MGRGAGFWDFAQFQKLGEGVVELAVIVNFEAMQPGEGAGVFSQTEKGEYGEGAGSDGWMILAYAGYLAPKGGGLISPRAQQTPAGEGHGLDESCFGGIAGLKLEDEIRGDGVVAAHGCALENTPNGDAGIEPSKRCVL